MICPNCKKPVIVVEHNKIELDYCTICKGVWFDSGELDLFFASAKLDSTDLVMKNILTLPEVKSAHRRRKCPICGRGMRSTAIGQPAVNIDVCRKGDGMWFDGGEVHELLRQLANKPSTETNSNQKIITYLGEVFKFPE